MVRAYVLVRTSEGAEHGIAKRLACSTDPRLTVLHADPVFGPYDLVLECESPTLDELGDSLEQVVQRTPGVLHTTTCLSVRLP
jgi:DNA-binding Lrp family transcriptional regulator